MKESLKRKIAETKGSRLEQLTSLVIQQDIFLDELKTENQHLRNSADYAIGEMDRAFLKVHYRDKQLKDMCKIMKKLYSQMDKYVALMPKNRSLQKRYDPRRNQLLKD